MNNFKVGDTVRLRDSGSPLMMVTAVKEELVVCVWFDNERMNVVEFPDVCLAQSKPMQAPSSEALQ